MKGAGLSGLLCTAAMLAGCGGNAATALGLPASDAAKARLYTHTFKFTTSEQTFKVPVGVNSLAVVALGAEGGGRSFYPPGSYYGLGGRVHAVIPVRPGETLYVFVGGSGQGTTGGFNGGGSGGLFGSGGFQGDDGFGGGGASDVREHGFRLRDRIIVAAGGGGESEYGALGYGGKGGGLIGGTGGPIYSSSGYNGGGGTGGTQSQGGSGGAGGLSEHDGSPGIPGSFGRGGSGGDGALNPSEYGGGAGGGGGGGYYGGGGGGGGASAFASIYGGVGGGGGGGSSYIESSATRAETWKGWKNADGNGLVVFSWE
jgi:hypothetical protein